MIINYERVGIWASFLFVLNKLIKKLVGRTAEKYINYKLPNNNPIDLSKSSKIPKDSKQFLEWFVGFTDAEGCFSISSLKFVNHITLKFLIELHRDDVEILNRISETLAIGNVNIKGDSAIFVVAKFEDIINVLIPIFLKFPLKTTKYLDFTCFLQAIEIKNKVGFRGSLSQQDKVILNNLKDSMNKKRLIITEKEQDLLEKNISISKWWLLGFVEGEGTFGYKHLIPYFQIAQHKKNLFVLEAIEKYLLNVFKELKINSNNEEFKFHYALNRLTGVYSMTIVKVDLNFYYIIPFFESLQFLSRKKIDYEYWIIIVYLHKLGYYYLPEGKKLALQISSSTNKKRYSTSDSKIELPNIETIKILFDQTPPFDVNSELSHLNKVKEFTIAKGGRKGFMVYIYECKNDKNKILKGSPFSTYGDGHEVLGLRRSSRTIGRYIDTGKKYKDKYLFSSVPLTSNK